MKRSTLSDYTERILRVIIHIQENLDDPIALEELASIAHFSPYHFHRIFRGMMGETVAEHVRRIRLERAAYALCRTKKTVTELAFEAGYENMESFIRAFRKHFEQSPTEYRKEKREALRVSIEQKKIEGKSLGRVSGKGGEKMNSVEIKNLNSRRVVFVRHTGPYNECEAAWKMLCSWAGPKGLLTGETLFMGICYDDPEVTNPNKIRYDACVSVGPGVEGEGEVGVQEVPAGEYAVVIHKGPYENLKDTYAAFCGEWLPTSGRELKNGPSIEVYLNSPEDTPPEKLLVEIQMPLEEE